MQIMGAVVRELGYREELQRLPSMPGLTIEYACRHLKALVERFGPDEPSLIAAYNAGSPRKTAGGMFENQRYVDKVSTVLNRLRALQ